MSRILTRAVTLIPNSNPNTNPQPKQSSPLHFKKIFKFSGNLLKGVQQSDISGNLEQSAAFS
jgi:hypothetical protein